jgi:hypothetical protein
MRRKYGRVTTFSEELCQPSTFSKSAERLGHISEQFVSNCYTLGLEL